MSQNLLFFGQVISSLASVQAYFDFFSQKIEKEAQVRLSS